MSNKVETIQLKLHAVERALGNEQHVLAERPHLTWQQLHNRLQGTGLPLAGRLARERDRRSGSGAAPWFRQYSALRESGTLIRTFTDGAGAAIASCAVSPDGSWIASLDRWDLTIWDADSGARRQIRTDSTHNEHCAVSPDGTWLVTVAGEGLLSVWDVASGSTVAELFDSSGAGKIGWLYGCVVSPDAAWIVTTGLTILDVSTGIELATLDDSDASNAVEASPDGRWVVADVDRHGTLKIWDVASRTERATLAGHTGEVNACAVGPDGKWIVSASKDGTLKIWDVASRTERATLAGHTGEVNACAVGPDGKWIVSASNDRTLKIWDVASRTERTSLVHDETVSDCAVSPDGTRVISAGSDGRIKVWELGAGLGHSVGGHTGPVTDCVMSPDGSWVASAGDDGTIKIWDVATATERSDLSGQVDSIGACAVSPDGTWIVAAPDDEDLIVWNVTTSTERSALAGRGGIGRVEHCTVSPDGTWIATGSRDALTLWDVATGTERMRFTDGGEQYLCAVGPDGTWIVSAAEYRNPRLKELKDNPYLPEEERRRRMEQEPARLYLLKMWDVARRKVMRTLSGSTSAVSACVVSPDGSYVVAGGADGTIRIWDVASGTERSRCQYAWAVHACAVSPDAEWIIVATGDRTVRLLTAADLAERASLVLPAAVSSLTCHPSSPIIACGDKAGGLTLAQLVGVEYWPAIVTAVDLGDGPEIRCPSCNGVFHWALEHQTEETACPYVGCGAELQVNPFIAGTDRWDADGAVSATIYGHQCFDDEGEQIGRVKDVTFSPDGHWLASRGTDANWDPHRGVVDTVKLWDAGTGAQWGTLRERRTTDGSGPVSVSCVAFSPNGTCLATGRRLWNAATGTERATLDGHDHSVNDMAFSPDGKWIASADDDWTIKIWDAATGTERAALAGHTGKVNACAVGPDGKRIASASDDGTIKIWDAATGTERATLVGHDRRVNDVTFSPDGKWVVSASDDWTIKIWDAATGAERATIKAHGGKVRDVAFSPDGRWLASRGQDEDQDRPEYWAWTVKLWDTDRLQEAVLTRQVKAESFAIHPSRPVWATGKKSGSVRLTRLVGIEYGPLIVTAVDLGNGLEIRCPHCNRMIPWKEEYRSEEMPCPLEGCGGPLKVNSFVVGGRA